MRNCKAQLETNRHALGILGATAKTFRDAKLQWFTQPSVLYFMVFWLSFLCFSSLYFSTNGWRPRFPLGDSPLYLRDIYIYILSLDMFFLFILFLSPRATLGDQLMRNTTTSTNIDNTPVAPYACETRCELSMGENVCFPCCCRNCTL